MYVVRVWERKLGWTVSCVVEPGLRQTHSLLSTLNYEFFLLCGLVEDGTYHTTRYCICELLRWATVEAL